MNGIRAKLDRQIQTIFGLRLSLSLARSRLPYGLTTRPDVHLNSWVKLLSEQIEESRPSPRLYFSLTSHSNYGPFTREQVESGLFRSLLAARLGKILGAQCHIRVRDATTVMMTCNVSREVLQETREDGLQDIIEYLTQFEAESKSGYPVLNVSLKD
jgi:hypothetical protein